MKNMAIDKKRWIILVAACVTNLCLGSVYAWSVFAAALTEYFNAELAMSITVADLAIVYTVANSVGPITMISGGWFNDRLGPKKVIALGGVMFGGGMFLAGFAKSIPMLLITYGLIGGLGLGMAYGCTISTSVKYFPDKRGLTGGLTTAAYGLSSVIIPPIVTMIVAKSSVAASFKIIGAVFCVLILCCTFFMEQCPPGYLPEGYEPPEQEKTGKDYDWKEMIKTPIFYVMILLLMCGAFSGMMVISQASGIAQNMIGMASAAAGVAVSVLALFNACGRLAAGSISDKIGRINTLTLACMISIVGAVLLYISDIHTFASFYAGIALIGISFGAFMGVFPGFTADQFGGKNNSVNYGIMFIGFAVSGYFGPQVMKIIYTSTGIYQMAFLAAIVLNVMGIILTLIYRKMK